MFLLKRSVTNQPTGPWNLWKEIVIQNLAFDVRFLLYHTSPHLASYRLWFWTTDSSILIIVHDLSVVVVAPSQNVFPPPARCMSRSASVKPVWRVDNWFNSTALSPPTDYRLPLHALCYSWYWCFLHFKHTSSVSSAWDLEPHPLILCSDEEKEGTVCLLKQLQKMKYNQGHLMNLFLNKNSKSALILCSSAATGCHSMSHQCKCVASYFLMSVCNHSRSAARCTCWGGNYWQPLVLTRCVGLQSCEVISLA